ncbi:flagellar basal body-associated FliL family protein [Sulfuriflexus mobilis]|uniref:flagellar basal body-associated FliL family protein n=1 Tax=Sulfuriflexus mobilis TaxID=1811807 RepID=UPI000F81792C|nr:flagellar basal body-associated FliL family protein [Sulfuriflexus mobilis]
MAIEEEDLELDAEAAVKGKSSKVKIIIIALVVLILMGTSIGVTLYFTGAFGSAEEQGEEKAEAEVKQPEQAGKLIYHAFEPPFVVNFEDKGVVRFLQIGLSVMTKDEGVITSIQQHDPVLRNNLVLLFSSQSFKTLTTREGKEALRAQTLKEIQGALEKQGAKSAVEEVFFTSFVIQ